MLVSVPRPTDFQATVADRYHDALSRLCLRCIEIAARYISHMQVRSWPVAPTSPYCPVGLPVAVRVINDGVIDTLSDGNLCVQCVDRGDAPRRRGTDMYEYPARALDAIGCGHIHIQSRFVQCLGRRL